MALYLKSATKGNFRLDQAVRACSDVAPPLRTTQWILAEIWLPWRCGLLGQAELRGVSDASHPVLGFCQRVWRLLVGLRGSGDWVGPPPAAVVNLCLAPDATRWWADVRSSVTSWRKGLVQRRLRLSVSALKDIAFWGHSSYPAARRRPRALLERPRLTRGL